MNVISLIKSELETITGIPKIVVPNESYKPVLGTPWIRLSSTEGEPVQITIGRNRMLRYTGSVQIDLFSALNTGDNPMVETVKQHFLKFENRFLGSGTYKLQIQSIWKGNVVAETNWSRSILFIRYFYTTPTPA